MASGSNRHFQHFWSCWSVYVEWSSALKINSSHVLYMLHKINSAEHAQNIKTDLT